MTASPGIADIRRAMAATARYLHIAKAADGEAVLRDRCKQAKQLLGQACRLSGAGAQGAKVTAEATATRSCLPPWGCWAAEAESEQVAKARSHAEHVPPGRISNGLGAKPGSQTQRTTLARGGAAWGAGPAQEGLRTWRPEPSARRGPRRGAFTGIMTPP